MAKQGLRIYWSVWQDSDNTLEFGEKMTIASFSSYMGLMKHLEGQMHYLFSVT
jgi:hypothetical protein